MNRTSIVVAALSLSFPFAGMAQSTVQTANLSSPMSLTEVHNLMKSAHTSAEYLRVAGYFHQQEADYRAKAAAEKAERDRRAQVNASLYQKYPRPADTAEARYESYLADANGAAIQAQHFDQLAAGQGKHNEQLASQSKQ
jgi:hypothetical protein